MRRALGLTACFVAGLALFAVGGVAGAADGLTSSSTSTTTTTTAPAPTSTAASTTTTTATTAAPTTSAPAATTTAPTTTAAPAPGTTTTTATTTTASPQPEPLPWWLQLWLSLRNRQQPESSGTKVTTSSSSNAKSGSSSSSSSSSASSSSSSSSSSSAAAAPAEEAFVPPPPPPPPAPARLVVTAHATQGDLTVGSTLTVTYTVQNTGGRPAAALLTDALPAALAPIYVDSDQGTCTGDGTVRCALGSLGPGRSADVTLVLQVMKAATFVNVADAEATDDAVAVSDPASLRFKAGSSAAVRLTLPR